MENESEAIYNEDDDRNLVIDDGDETETNIEPYAYDETFDPDYAPPADQQTETNAEKQIEEIKSALSQKSLSPFERGKKLAEFNKLRRDRGIAKKKPKSMSKKSGVIFPVKRVLENLKNMFPEKIISQQAGVYLASVLEYMCSEVLDLSGEVARQIKKKRITPHFIQLSINGDEELNKLLKNTIIAQGGVTPHIHPELLVTRTKYQKRPAVNLTEMETEQELIGPKLKKIDMVEHASQTEPIASKTIDDASQTDIVQSTAEMLSPDATLVEETPEKKRNLIASVKKKSDQTESIDQREITSAQVAPLHTDTYLELSEINSQIENITGINIERESSPAPRQQTSLTEEINLVGELSTRASSASEECLETILETENRGNNSDKNASINIESYLNIQASSEKLVDKILNNKENLLPSKSNLTLQNILKPLENQILVIDRKIVPNVLFKNSKYSKKRSNKSEN